MKSLLKLSGAILCFLMSGMMLMVFLNDEAPLKEIIWILGISKISMIIFGYIGWKLYKSFMED